jgi:uncharacterized membrane protein YdbT with pleckstrin-like domain
MPLLSEETIFFARPSMRRAWFFSVLYLAVVLAGIAADTSGDLFLLWRLMIFGMVIPFMVTTIQRYCTSYTVTERNVKSATGVFSRSFASVPLQRITNFYARQTLLDRMLRIVTVDIDAAGGEGPEIVFERINTGDFRKAATLFEEVIRQSKEHPATSSSK